MKDASRTRFALLGLLTLGPMTGYDMRKFIDTAISHFWRESFGNIYPILRQLHKDGLVTVREKSQSGRPDRRIYRLTKKGEREFERWQCEAVPEEHFKSVLLLKMFFGDHLPPEIAKKHLLDFIDSQEALLKTYESERKEIEKSSGDKPPGLFWLMTLRRGELVARARLTWAHGCLKTFDQLESTGRSKKRSATAGKNGGRKS